MIDVSGFATPVPEDRRGAYGAAARATWDIFRAYSALWQMEAYGDNVPEGNAARRASRVVDARRHRLG